MHSIEELARAATPMLSFIQQHWTTLTANARHGHADRLSDWIELAKTSNDGHLDDLDPTHPYILYLPHDFVTPGGRFVVQFYWDSYFILLGLLDSGHLELARGMVENCFHLIEHHGLVIANRKRWAAGSQLPFLTSMVREVYNKTRDRKWLAGAIPFIEKEYWGYWLNADHLAFRGLSRYHAPSMYPAASIAAITIDHEASWDLSPRFDEKDVLDLLPIDLNCNLYGYERDLAYFSRELGRSTPGDSWDERASQRSSTMMDLMWNDDDSFFYDYDFVHHRQKPIKSLASFFPMFYGFVSEQQARRLVDQLPSFEHSHGLVTCEETYGYTDRQWNYPIGWAPLHWIVFSGLKRYGYLQDANRIALKWLNLNVKVWQHEGALFEKYDVVRGSEKVLQDRYTNQQGFGWTNGVFVRLFTELTEHPPRPGDHVDGNNSES